MKPFREILEKKMTGDGVKKQHEKWLKLFQGSRDLKSLYKDYLKSGFMSKNTDYDTWFKYMKDEIKARKQLTSDFTYVIMQLTIRETRRFKLEKIINKMYDKDLIISIVKNRVRIIKNAEGTLDHATLNSFFKPGILLTVKESKVYNNFICNL